jgi:RNA polymerase sigma-70 factor (ECF subfamily)
MCFPTLTNRIPLGPMSFDASLSLNIMTSNQITTSDEKALIELARSGDERAYESLIEGHRAELHAHCYRMLASVHDADDAVQEALLRAWRGLPGFESRSSIRTWLFRIATNSSFDLLKARKRRDLPVNVGYRAALGDTPGDALFTESWLEPYPDRLDDLERSPEARYEARESLELAFVAALQYLPGRQRAVLILREVLRFSAIEVAEILDVSVAAVNSALQRARATIADRLPGESQKAELERLGGERVRELARQYADAIDQGNVEELMSMLTADATWSMPPHPAYYQGRTVVEEFLRRDVSSVRWRHRITTANGQLAVGCYIYDEQRAVYVATVLDVLNLRNDKIAAVTAFFTAEAFESEGERNGYLPAVDIERFGLPSELLD